MNDETEQRVLDSDLANVLSTEGGRRLLWHLISARAGFGREVFGGRTVEEFEATHRAAYLDGRRSIALELTAECQRVDAPNYVRMLSEALDRQRLAEQSAKRAAEESKDGGTG